MNFQITELDLYGLKTSAMGILICVYFLADEHKRGVQYVWETKGFIVCLQTVHTWKHWLLAAVPLCFRQNHSLLNLKPHSGSHFRKCTVRGTTMRQIYMKHLGTVITPLRVSDVDSQKSPWRKAFIHLCLRLLIDCRRRICREDVWLICFERRSLE